MWIVRSLALGLLLIMDSSREMTGEQTLLHTLARLLHGENRSNLDPQEAYGIVDTVFNRTGLRGYPDDPLDVILQPKQYSPFNPSDPNYPVIQKFGPGHPEWEKYLNLAATAVSPVRMRSQYTHYFAGKPPAWASKMEGLTKVGSHWFGREKRQPK